MLSRDYRDVVGGMLLLITGIGFSWYAIEHYPLGTLRQMGPGMFPMGLGFTLAILAVSIIIPALLRPGVVPEIRKWTPLFVLSGVAAFALAIQPLGLVAAILGVVIISSFAELRIRPVSLALLCAGLCLMAWLTFKIGLGLPVYMFRWPF